MLNKVRKISFLFILVLLIVGCNPKQEASENKTLTFSGEGEIWEIKDYQIEITPDKFTAGNGELSMKNTKEYISHSLWFSVTAEINGREQGIQSYGQSHADQNIAFKKIGTISLPHFIDENGNPITNYEIKNLYFTIGWEDSQGKLQTENIYLD